MGILFTNPEVRMEVRWLSDHIAATLGVAGSKKKNVRSLGNKVFCSCIGSNQPMAVSHEEVRVDRVDKVRKFKTMQDEILDRLDQVEIDNVRQSNQIDALEHAVEQLTEQLELFQGGAGAHTLVEMQRDQEMISAIKGSMGLELSRDELFLLRDLMEIGY